MSPLAFIAVTATVGVIYSVWRDVLPLLERLVAVQEVRYAAQPTQVPAEPMPEDLIAMTQSMAEEWARDDTIAAMRESYAELGDWMLVRQRFQGSLS